MTPQEIHKLEKAGYSPEKINLVINMMFLLADVQEQYALEFQRMLKAAGMFSFDMKHHVQKAITEARNLVKFVDKNCNYDFAVKYGDKADKLKELLDEWGKEN